MSVLATEQQARNLATQLYCDVEIRINGIPEPEPEE